MKGNSPSSPDLQAAASGAFGAGACAALGAGSAAPVCAKIGAKVLPEFTKPRYILGSGPPSNAQIRDAVLAEGRTDLARTRDSYGTVPLTQFAEIVLREEGGKATWSSAPTPTTAPASVTIRDNKVQGDPWLVGTAPKPASTGTWVSASTGPAMSSRGGRGQF